jgi:alpha-beta hydrolase superfamily lysophospholipase
MIDTLKGPEKMDHPEVIARLFFPRREQGRETSETFNRPVQVDKNIHIVCRVFPSRNDAPNLLFFHGNGETAPDYDYVAPFYRKSGMNLFVADFRGYGMSDGSPSCSGIIQDAHPIFKSFASFIDELGYTGGLYVMGRSLGSAPAIEVAYHYQRQLKGLIVESGFASSRNQFARLGVTHLFRDTEDPVGFCNDIKIKEILIPTLIIHGEADQIIPVEEGKALYELSNARDKTSFFVPHAGHNDLMERSLSDYMHSIVRFISSVESKTID